MLAAKHSGIAVCPDRSRVLAGLQGTSGRAADRLRRKRIVYVRPLLSHAIKIGRQIAGITVNPCRIPSLLIGKENDNIGFLTHFHTPFV